MHVGIASAFLNIATYSMASLIWPLKAEYAIAMLEAFGGIGLILGPIIGSAIYSWLGFRLSFFILGAVQLPIALIAYFYIAKRLREVDRFIAVSSSSLEKTLDPETSETQDSPE